MNISYWDLDNSLNVTGATLNASIIKIEDPVSGKIWDISNWTETFGNFTENIFTYPEPSPGERYIVTMNTSWLPYNLILYWRLEANKTGYDNAITQINIHVRDIMADIIIVSPPLSIDTDLASQFSIILDFYDCDNGFTKIRNDTSDPKYDGISFWIYDDYSKTESTTYWGRNFDYGTFLANYQPVEDNYNITFFINCCISDNFTIRIRANGSHLGGPSIGEEYAEDSRLIIFSHKNHTTNITNNPMEKINGEYIVPQVPEFEDFNLHNTIIYGQSVNISLFWYDLNSSEYKYGLMNRSGITETMHSPEHINITTKFPFGGIIGDLVGLYNVTNMYEYKQNNLTYMGIYIIEINTSKYLENYPSQDVINGGPFNNGTYNFTINFQYSNVLPEINYLLSSIEIWLHILPIKTNLEIERYELHSINGNNTVVNEPIFPFGVPGSPYFFKVFLNYSRDDGTSLDIIDSYSLKFWNGTYWKAWQIGKVEHFQSILHELRIYTDTEDTQQIPWNQSGYKNVTLKIEFSKINHQNKTLIQTIFLRKHYTTIQWCNETTKDPIIPIKINDTINSSYDSFTIFFRYIDLDNFNDSLPTYSGGEKYITYANVSFIGWEKEFAEIHQTPIPGLYELILQINNKHGEYNLTIYADDNHPDKYRNITYLKIRINIIKVTNPRSLDFPFFLLGLLEQEQFNYFLFFFLIAGVVASTITIKLFISNRKKKDQQVKTSSKTKTINDIENFSKLEDKKLDYELQKFLNKADKKSEAVRGKLIIMLKNLGRYFWKMHQYSEALICYKKIIELDPNDLSSLTIIDALREKIKEK